MPRFCIGCPQLVSALNDVIQLSIEFRITISKKSVYDRLKVRQIGKQKGEADPGAQWEVGGRELV